MEATRDRMHTALTNHDFLPMESFDLLKDADIGISILTLLDVRTLVKLRQVSRDLCNFIDTCRYLWVHTLRDVWREYHVPYPSRVPIADLPLDEIIRAAQTPFKFGYCLEHRPEWISSSSVSFTAEAAEGPIYLLRGGRWMLYVSSSGSNLALADLGSIEDGHPQISHEVSGNDAATQIYIRGVQWHEELQCVIVFVTSRDYSAPAPAIVKIDWSPTEPHTPSFSPRTAFDSGPVDRKANAILSGDYFLFSNAAQVIWNWRTNKRITLSIPNAQIEELLSSTEVLVSQYDPSETAWVYSIVTISSLDDIVDAGTYLYKSKLLSTSPDRGSIFKLRNWKSSRAEHFIHSRRELNPDAWSYSQTYEAITLKTTDRIPHSSIIRRRLREPYLIIWRSNDIIATLPHTVSYANGKIGYSFFDVDHDLSVGPVNLTKSHINVGQEGSKKEVFGHLIAMCGVSGTLITSVDSKSYSVVRLSCDVSP